jgi:hypothetical protein
MMDVAGERQNGLTQRLGLVLLELLRAPTTMKETRQETKGGKSKRILVYLLAPHTAPVVVLM